MELKPLAARNVDHDLWEKHAAEGELTRKSFEQKHAKGVDVDLLAQTLLAKRKELGRHVRDRAQLRGQQRGNALLQDTSLSHLDDVSVG